MSVTTSEALSLREVVGKTVVAHTVSYAIIGMIAFQVMSYPTLFAEPGLRGLMRPTDDPLLVLGPAYQLVRGVVFGVAFHVLRSALFGVRHGWLRIWMLLVAFGILGTFGPSPGSLEGIFYTTLSWSAHARGLPEVLLQSLALSGLVFAWVGHPERKWLTGILVVLYALLLGVVVLGLLAT